MLPNAEDAPLQSTQLSIHHQISFSVALNFGGPKFPVSFGLHVAFRASVPKTPIHKDCHSLFEKNEVRLSENWVMPPPASDLGGSQQFHHCKLGAEVSATPNLGHDFGSFGFGNCVSHSVLW